MNRAYSAILIASAVTASACASPRGAQDFGTPAVHELARLQSMGQLDQERLACAIAALPSVTEMARAQLVESRSARDALLAGAASDHASSVQRAMRASDRSDAAVRAAIEERRAADGRRARGDLTGAAIQASHAIDLQSYAVAQGEFAVFGPVGDEFWSDEEADLLVEYAGLRLARAEPTEPSIEVRDRIATIEREHPKVVNGYASLLIDLHRDPALPCAEGP